MGEREDELLDNGHRTDGRAIPAGKVKGETHKDKLSRQKMKVRQTLNKDDLRPWPQQDFMAFPTGDLAGCGHVDSQQADPSGGDPAGSLGRQGRQIGKILRLTEVVVPPRPAKYPVAFTEQRRKGLKHVGGDRGLRGKLAAGGQIHEDGRTVEPLQRNLIQGFSALEEMKRGVQMGPLVRPHRDLGDVASILGQLAKGLETQWWVLGITRAAIHQGER